MTTLPPPVTPPPPPPGPDGPKPDASKPGTHKAQTNDLASLLAEPMARPWYRRPAPPMSYSSLTQT